MSNMTAQEALKVLETIRKIWEVNSHSNDAIEAVALGITALQASIPRVLTLDEARAMEPRAAIYAEFLNHPDVITGPYAVETILHKGGFPQYGKTVRWWTAWPDEELRKATAWDNQQP